MPIRVTCPGCGKTLKAKDSLAGRAVACPGCGGKLLIPQAQDEGGAYALQAAPPPPPAVEAEPEREEPAPLPAAARRSLSASKAAARATPLTSRETPLWPRHLHWLLVLALIPLAVSILGRREGKEDFMERLLKTLEQAPAEARPRITQALERLEDDKGSVEELFAALPGRKLAGASLPRNTRVHWLFAAGSAVLFLAFAVFLAVDGSAEPLHLLAVGLFTATAGIVFLLVVQTVADWTQGVWVRGSGVVVLLFYVLKLIGFSYRAALEPEYGFFLSFVGYTLGVGLCEELCKALPVIWRYRRPAGMTWRGAFLWGLASGVGFGVSEGVMYAGDYYNGVSGPGVYFVRFFSCVALHALWTGAAAITLHRRQDLLQGIDVWYGYLPPLVYIVGVPMLLHGLYDTLLKKDLDAGALAVAVLSFVYLAFQIYRLHDADDEAAKAEMFREYRRRRAALS